jgi:hypothetical protein
MPLYEIKVIQKNIATKLIEARSSGEAEQIALTDLDFDDFDDVEESETILDKVEMVGAKTYKVEISFQVEKELTQDQLDNLEGHLLLQINEPYNEENEPENYTATNTTYKIERVK